ncbi:MAG: triose-phosphate isomerase [Bacteroidia bacterium]|nr:triose-phosphate isomerase [Bacteroidia bacterium]
MARKLLAANWKMNLTLIEAQGLTSEIVSIYQTEIQKPIPIILAPPFPFLHAVHHLAKDAPRFQIAAQTVHHEPKGAFTGSVSAPMLVSVGCSAVIIGHSECRQAGDTDELLVRKVKIALQHKLRPIFCIGETLTQRENNQTFSVIEKQLSWFLSDSRPPDNEFQQIIFAYEPVWAIGTGKTATPEQAQEVHAWIREKFTSVLGALASQITILYGGSVTPQTAKDLFKQPDIDGGLIGGASLKARDFIEIAKSF